MLGFDLAMTGNLDRAHDELELAMSAFEAADDVFMTAWAHYGLANVADLAGDYAAARAGFMETLRLLAEDGRRMRREDAVAYALSSEDAPAQPTVA